MYIQAPLQTQKLKIKCIHSLSHILIKMSRNTNTHKHSHIYTNSSTHMQKSHMYKHICTFPHEQIYMHKCTLIHNTYMYMDNKYSYRHRSTCIYPQLHICTQITYIHTHAIFHTYFCIHRPIHTFSCTYIYIHVHKHFNVFMH